MSPKILVGKPLLTNNTHLVERESIGADPRVLHIVLAVMEDLAIQLFISIVSSLFVHTVELGLLQ